MNKIEKIKAEIERRKKTWNHQDPQYVAGGKDVCDYLLGFIDSLEEEPVSNTILLYGLSGSVGIEEAVKETEEYKEWQGDPERQQSFIDFAKFGANYKHHTSNDLEEAAHSYVDTTIEWFDSEGNPCCYPAFIAGAQWQKQQDQSTIELAEDHAMLAGMEKMKQEMMGDAVDAEVITDTVIVERETMKTFLKYHGLKTGDKVKLIIIREE